MRSDPLAFWQRERKRWWVRMLSFPENVELRHVNQEASGEDTDTFCLEYKAEEGEQEASQLEEIRHVTGLDDGKSFLKQLLNSDRPSENFLLRETSQMIITQTTCEKVLESVLLDSVQLRRDKSELLNLVGKEEEPMKRKVVFRLDYRLAPYKACIVYCGERGEAAARDLKKMFYYNQIEVLLMSVKREEELDEKHEWLDELGVPYAIYLPQTLAKDGVCFVRNRETTLQEQLHISLIIEQFRAVSNALSF